MKAAASLLPLALCLLNGCSKETGAGSAPASSAAAPTSKTGAAVVPTATGAAGGGSLESMLKGASDAKGTTTNIGGTPPAGPTGATILCLEGFKCSGLSSEGYGPQFSMGDPKEQMPESMMFFLYAERLAAAATEPKNVAAQELTAGAYEVMVQKPTFEAKQSLKIGRDDNPAWVWKGKGTFVGGGRGKGEWGVYIFSILVGGNKSVTIHASWKLDRPEREKTILEAVRTLKG
jgi:hypothetical protein